MSDSDAKDGWDHIIEFEKELYKNFRAEDIDPSGCKYLGEDVYAVMIIGRCPVEYTGVVGDHCFYFKSRGTTWSMNIADSRDNSQKFMTSDVDNAVVFSSSGLYSNEEHSAGNMLAEQAVRIILSCVALWRSGQSIR